MSKDSPPRHLYAVVGIAGISLVLLITVLWGVSEPFEYGSKLTRPILLMTSIFVFATVPAFVGLLAALRISKSNFPKQLLFFIVCTGIALRAIGVFTPPMLEIDYYRYLWDGKVSSHGVSPYLYSPTRILQALPDQIDSYQEVVELSTCLLYTSPSPRDLSTSRMPSSA